jgi:heme oxygenase
VEEWQKMSLKELTSEKHKLAERHPFNVRLISGDINTIEYISYLYQLRAVFKKLEENELPHIGMNRLYPITTDIIELIPKHTPFVILQSTSDYVSHLDTLSVEERLPHVYLNYMALLFGGQMFRKVLPGNGLLYQFDNPQEIIQSIRNIQDDSWADEVNLGFDYIIGIFDELQQLFERHSE